MKLIVTNAKKLHWYKLD